MDQLSLFADVIVVASVLSYLGAALALDTPWMQIRLALLEERARQRRDDGYKVNLEASPSG